MKYCVSLLSPSANKQPHTSVSRQLLAKNSHREPSLLRCFLSANSNPGHGVVSRKLVDTVMTLAPRHAYLKSPLLEYLLTNRPLVEIAKKHSCTISALVYRATKLGFPTRRRGRRVLLAPAAAHNRVIALVREYGVAEAARRASLSRQRVYQILYRWAPEWKGRWPLQDAMRQQPPKRRTTRSVVIAFRLTRDEWKSLQATKPSSGASDLSANEWAREVVLRHLATATGTGCASAQDSTAQASGTASDKIVNFIAQHTVRID